MKIQLNHRQFLFAGVATIAIAGGSEVWAQAPAEPQGVALEQVVVTATRQSNTVNRVPLAVSAQTQRALDQQGIRNINDLQATVPSLRIGATESAGTATIAIRGIVQTSPSAPTTGFYLDEIPLQKRAGGGFGSINGTPIPPLFDLDRIEVLRGPQGTLFGGGSEGGTIRYIQPQPSLTRYSTYARAQVMSTKGGDLSYEGGVAVGGPIIQDKLGFRASVFARHNGGYVDLTDYRTGRVYDANANHGETRLGRLAVTWAPTSDIKITASYLGSHDDRHQTFTTTNPSVPGVVSVPQGCVKTNVAPSPANAFVVPLPLGPNCPPGFFTTKAYTIGPLNLGADQALVLGPSTYGTDLHISSVDGSWEFAGGHTLRSISSYTEDVSTGVQPQTFPNTLITYAPLGGATYTVPGQTPLRFNGGFVFNPNITADLTGLGLGSQIEPATRNRRTVFTQELRMSSPADARPLSWVAGLYYSNSRQHIVNRVNASPLAWQQFGGLTIEQRFGVIPFPGYFALIDEADNDQELAAFADATFKLGDHWRVLGGLRFSRITTSFTQSNSGPNGGTLSPRVSDGSLKVGTVTENPITPKIGLQYLITPDDMIYISAAKGFRPGGVNQVCAAACQSTLSRNYGYPLPLSPANLNKVVPPTYASDSVWSYELGAKLRLLDGRAQINADIYRIDWSNVQWNVSITDVQVFNVPTARSEGAELEAQFRPISNLTLNGALTYGKASFTSGLAVPATVAGAPALVVAVNGLELPAPNWTADVGARFDARLAEAVRGYARVDYRWQKQYLRSAPGINGYEPDTNVVPSVQTVNLRFGAEFKDFDFNVFVNNAMDDRSGPMSGGRGGCQNLACSTFASFLFTSVSAQIPRQIGLQVVYRH
jgi:iron complex outermembrane receptor protein